MKISRGQIVKVPEKDMTSTSAAGDQSMDVAPVDGTYAFIRCILYIELLGGTLKFLSLLV